MAHHNITRCNHLFNNIDQNNSSLSGQPNAPSVVLLDLPQLPSLPMFLPHLGPPYLPPAKHPPSQHKETQPAATLPTLIHVETNWTSGSSIYPTPPSPANNYPYYKKAPTLPLLPSTPPIEAYITATELASSKLPTQEAEDSGLM